MVCNLLVHLDKKYSPYPLKKKLIHSPYICVLTKLSFVCMFAIQYKDIFLTKVKALAKIPFFREMPRFIHCRLNDIFSLIMTFRIGFEFLYQINKNVSTFKYYLEGGVNYIGVLWQYQIFFFLSVTQMLSMLHQV